LTRPHFPPGITGTGRRLGSCFANPVWENAYDQQAVDLDRKEWADLRWIGSAPRVEGDPQLTEWIDFPCPADVLAAELRRINRPLRLRDLNNAPTARGQQLTA
jgi:hypothetical protein